MTGAKVWVLDRRVFQHVMKKTGMQRIDDNVNFLRSVPLLENLGGDHMSKIADMLEVVSLHSLSSIIRLMFLYKSLRVVSICRTCCVYFNEDFLFIVPMSLKLCNEAFKYYKLAVRALDPVCRGFSLFRHPFFGQTKTANHSKNGLK